MLALVAFRLTCETSKTALSDAINFKWSNLCENKFKSPPVDLSRKCYDDPYFFAHSTLKDSLPFWHMLFLGDHDHYLVK